MMITFHPNAWQRTQLLWSCACAGIACQRDNACGTLTCYFDDATDLMAWHRAFVRRFAWSPMATEVMVAESEVDFEAALLSLRVL